MIKQILLKLTFLIVISTLFIGCSSKKDENIEGNTDKDIEENIEDKTEDKTEGDDKVDNNGKVISLESELNEYQSELMEKASGWSNGNMFDCTWRADNIIFEDGIMKMIIDSDGEDAKPKWSGAEYRSRKFYHYGLYEVRMKPIKNDGIVSSFFTYTGPSDNNPWDEIDIEFLGKDTSKIQFNYFTDGVGNNEYIHDLGFDAVDDFHIYGFEWLPDSITWYVDGEIVHKATSNIPSVPSKLMMNVWPGIGVDGWLKAFDGTVPLTAEYDWIRITEYTDLN